MSGSSTVVGARPKPLREVLGVYVALTGVAALLYRAPWAASWYQVALAAMLLYLPAWALRGRELGDYGLRARPLGRLLLLTSACVAVVFPLFFVGFLGWARLACALEPLRALTPTPCLDGALAAWSPRWPPELITLDPRRNLLVAELLVVALPEEFFFRGYVQTRLAEAWPARRRLWGAPVGAAWVAASALFALCHLAVQGSVATLVVFFPGLLFGWMRARSGSILPGTLAHALCNVYLMVLLRSAHG